MKFGYREIIGFVAGLIGGLAVFAAVAGDAVVSIDKYAFNPRSPTVKVGTTVIWRNDEKRTSHDIVVPGLGAASERLMPGDVFKLSFDKPGRYPYLCEAHKDRPEMHGEIMVEE